MTGRDDLHLESILERGYDFRDGVIRRGNQVEAAGDQMDLGIYGCGRLDDLVDPGVRATDHQHNSIRRVDGQRQLLELPGAWSFRHKGDQGYAGDDFGGLVDEFKVVALPGRAEGQDLGWFAVEVAHVRRQGFGLPREARRQRRAVDAEELLGRVALHLWI